jgi:superfamily II DNA/RNA helicase
LKALQQLEHVVATPIQQQVIPRVLAGKDVIATAQTGTGKTAAYLLPALEKITLNPRKNALPRILVLVPTRELATQVKDAAHAYGRHLHIQVASIVGGMPYRAQLRQLAKPVDIIVATPGRLIDHHEQKRINLSAIEILVLDEADRMLDMGFKDDVTMIVSALPKKRQTLLFTATLNRQLMSLANSILHHPEKIEALGKTVTLEKIEQRLHIADDNQHKLRLLKHVMANESIYKGIIFSATKRGAESLARQLRDQGFRTGALHGDMRQPQRNKTLLQLREGKIQLLVATDVAARGIDVNDISHVINYDMPRFAEDYVHRIGRTGRAGKSGIAISLVTSSEVRALRSIEKFTQSTFKPIVIEGLAPRRTLHQEQPRSNTNRRHKKPASSKASSSKPQHRSARFAKSKPSSQTKENRRYQ